jgi:transposase
LKIAIGWQPTLLPESLDDYVAEENTVQVADVFFDELDLRGAGLRGDGGGDGPPGLSSRDAAETLRLRIPEQLYVYGYLNEVQCSR